jgi:hypothetical protein
LHLGFELAPRPLGLCVVGMDGLAGLVGLVQTSVGRGSKRLHARAEMLSLVFALRVAGCGPVGTELIQRRMQLVHIGLKPTPLISGESRSLDLEVVLHGGHVPLE